VLNLIASAEIPIQGHWRISYRLLAGTWETDRGVSCGLRR